MRLTAPRAIVLVAASLFVFAGCGEVEVSGNVNKGDEIDAGTLEKKIADEAEKQTDTSWTVECPDDVKFKKDDEFDCSGTDAEDYEVRFAVTQTDGKGNVDFQLVDDVETTEGEGDVAPEGDVAGEEDAATEE